MRSPSRVPIRREGGTLRHDGDTSSARFAARYWALVLLGSACLRRAPIGSSGATATEPQAEICRRYGDGASVPLERWGARSPTTDRESCRGVPLLSTTGRCLGW